MPFVALTDAAQARHCGPQALASLLAHAGRPVDVAQLAAEVYLPARGGSLQIEMLAAGRRHGLLALPLPGELNALFEALAAGRPVLVMQNLGLGWLPTWHYAVLVGVDPARREVLLRSADEARLALPWETFEYTWARAGHWAALLLPPGEWPPRRDPAAEEQAALDYARLASPADAERVWISLVARAPQRTVPAVALAGLLAGQGRLDEAAAVLQAAAERAPHVVLYNNLAELEARRGRTEAARTALARAVERAPLDDGGRWAEAVAQTARELGLGT